DTTDVTGTDTTDMMESPHLILYGLYTAAASNGIFSVDFIFIRQYAATEPTHGAWGSEEALYEITADFSGVPTSGIVPLTVYFTDNSSSTGDLTVTIDTWSWDFGDESPASTDQNPAHHYTTSGTYTVALTASNATYGTTDTETKTDYITVNIDSAAPTADFVATPLCEDVGDPIYFIDYSTGGGLYAWNWSFGDGNYSELRNPTHTYVSNGTYDISLTVWGANGTDTLTKTGYITIPCGAPTPTPTVTPTPTGTIPVQGDVDTGRISPLGFVMLAFINLGLVLHTFVNNESRNYLHVFTGIVAVIVSFMLGTFLITGFVQEDFVVTAAEVTVNSSVLSTYQVEQVSIIDASVGYYFVFIGILMALIVILSVIEIIREIQEG
ncbi:MAG: PKD domain-containing protein, partial [Dehalococcoidia bacterium]|nr:PKD domain-containing protein [Dehalococcoidia bacterium]